MVISSNVRDISYAVDLRLFRHFEREAKELFDHLGKEPEYRRTNKQAETITAYKICANSLRRRYAEGAIA